MLCECYVGLEYGFLVLELMNWFIIEVVVVDGIFGLWVFIGDGGICGSEFG